MWVDLEVPPPYICMYNTGHIIFLYLKSSKRSGGWGRGNGKGRSEGDTTLSAFEITFTWTRKKVGVGAAHTKRSGRKSCPTTALPQPPQIQVPFKRLASVIVTYVCKKGRKFNCPTKKKKNFSYIV